MVGDERGPAGLVEKLLAVLVGTEDRAVAVEEVDLLEREALGLRDELGSVRGVGQGEQTHEVGEEDAEQAGRAPQEEDLDLDESAGNA